MRPLGALGLGAPTRQGTADMIAQIVVAGLSHTRPAITAHAAATWPQTLLLSVAGGVLVAAILSVARVIWSRRRIPTALSRAVRRKTYLGAVLGESKRDHFGVLDLLAPRLTRAAGNQMIADIQTAWKQINDRGHVRVLTLDSRECLEGGLELLRDGIEVRVARRDLDSEDLSYHVFGTSGSAETAIVNHHDGNIDRPVRLNGQDPIKVFRKHFETIWQVASPLEAVIAEKIIENAHGSGEPAGILQVLKDTALKLEPCLDKVLPHLAFRNSSSVIFIVGLPGSGKSYVRHLLTERLALMGIKSREETDYLYAFRDFLHSLIKLEPCRVDGFEAYPGGAFAVRDEAALKPALQALEGAVRYSLKESEVTVAEFARSDLVAALDQFDDIRSRCRIIYVHAPPELRSARLSKRVEPPELSIDGRSVTVTPSDNHLLPSTAMQSLYATDDVERLEKSPRWRGQILRIDNDVDDGGANIKASINIFVDDVISLYRPPRNIMPTPASIADRRRAGALPQASRYAGTR
jgi:hypothetical protein